MYSRQKPLQPQPCSRSGTTHEWRFSQDIRKIIWGTRMKSASEASWFYFSVCVSSRDPVVRRLNEIPDFSGIIGWQLLNSLFPASCLFRPVMYFFQCWSLSNVLSVSESNRWTKSSYENGSRETRSSCRTNVTDSWFSTPLKYDISSCSLFVFDPVTSWETSLWILAEPERSGVFMAVSCDTVVDTVCWDAEAGV